MHESINFKIRTFFLRTSIYTMLVKMSLLGIFLMNVLFCDAFVDHVLVIFWSEICVVLLNCLKGNKLMWELTIQNKLVQMTPKKYYVIQNYLQGLNYLFFFNKSFS